MNRFITIGVSLKENRRREQKIWKRRDRGLIQWLLHVESFLFIVTLECTPLKNIFVSPSTISWAFCIPLPPCFSRVPLLGKQTHLGKRSSIKFTFIHIFTGLFWGVCLSISRIVSGDAYFSSFLIEEKAFGTLTL